jgi:hypothetical protein
MKENSKKDTKKKMSVVAKQNNAGGDQLSRDVEEFLGKLEHGASRLKEQSKRKLDCRTWNIGIDLGDKSSRYCFINAEGIIVAEGALATEAIAFGKYFSSIQKSRVALEVGTHSAWVSTLLEDYGHEVYVANPRKMESIHKNRRKNDTVDARTLARLVRADPELLYPIQHRSAEARQELVLLRAR